MKFKGLYTAMITPFCQGGKEIDFKAYEKLIQRQIDAGVQGIIPCGTTGESPTLSHEEHRELVARSVEYSKDKIQVIAGTGSNSTEEAIELTESACQRGANAVMLVSPYYNKPTQDGLYQHFVEIANNSSIPIMLYNIKGRTGVNIEVETIKKLSKHKKICAIKEASGDPVQMIRIKKEVGENITMLCGDDNIMPAFMGLGGHGVVSVASNIFPKRMMYILEKYMQYDFKNANKLFYEFVDFMNALFWETNPIPVKAVASLMGFCEPHIRLPLTNINVDLETKLKKILQNLGKDQ